MYDLIVARGFHARLEIGTSTGHSGIWIAWAMSKTGGKLVTVEIDPERYAVARKNRSFFIAWADRMLNATIP